VTETGEPAGAQRDTRGVVLVVGPHIPNAELRRHCLGALSVGRTVALVQLHPVTVSERYLLRALTRWYGQHSLRLVESHADWAAVSRGAMVVVLSDEGLWRDEVRVTDSSGARLLTRSAIERLYGEPVETSQEDPRS